MHQKKPRSCRRPRPPIHFRYSCGALPLALPPHTHPTTSIAHPGPRVTVASDPTRPQARSRYRTVQEETPRHPKGNFTHPPVGSISTPVPLSHQLAFTTCPRKLLLSSTPSFLDWIHFPASSSSAQAPPRYVPVAVRFTKALSAHFPQLQVHLI